MANETRSNNVFRHISTHLIISITWQIDRSDPFVSLLLIHNQQNQVIFDNQPNTGAYIWVPPANLTDGNYTMELGAGTKLI